MSQKNEQYFGDVVAKRKGKGYNSRRQQNPCRIKVGVDESDREVILRTLDKSGIASLVAAMDIATARQLIQGLENSIAALGLTA